MHSPFSRSHSIILSMGPRGGSQRRQMVNFYATQLCWLVAHGQCLQAGRVRLPAVQRVVPALHRTPFCVSGFGVASPPSHEPTLCT